MKMTGYLLQQNCIDNRFYFFHKVRSSFKLLTSNS